MNRYVTNILRGAVGQIDFNAVNVVAKENFLQPPSGIMIVGNAEVKIL